MFCPSASSVEQKCKIGAEIKEGVGGGSNYTKSINREKKWLDIINNIPIRGDLLVWNRQCSAHICRALVIFIKDSSVRWWEVCMIYMMYNLQCKFSLIIVIFFQWSSGWGIWFILGSWPQRKSPSGMTCTRLSRPRGNPFTWSHEQRLLRLKNCSQFLRSSTPKMKLKRKSRKLPVPCFGLLNHLLVSLESSLCNITFTQSQSVLHLNLTTF